jgi:Tfp pilus assembly protein PilO
MSKLPKEKRNKVILVWIVTVMVIVGWAFAVLSWQLDAKRRAGENLEKKRNQFASMKDKLSRKDEIEQDMELAETKLEGLETQMANAADTFSWVVTTIRDFKQSYEVDMPQFSPVSTGETTLLPKFPFRQAAVTVGGTAYYQDLGLFVADFENRFPFARIVNLDVSPMSSLNVADRDREKLNFKMDIIFLVKPSRS